MKKNHFWARTRIFFISFLLSLLIFGSMFAATYYFIILKNQSAAAQPFSEVPINTEYIPDEQDILNVALMICSERNQPAELFFLLHFDPQNSRAMIIELPSATSCSFRGVTRSLAEHYQYGSMDDCAQAINDLFFMDGPIYYLRMDKNAVKTAGDFFGGLTYYVPQELLTDDYHFLEGKQLLDGRRIQSLLFSPAFLQRSNLLSCFFSSHFTSDLTNRLDDFYNFLFEDCDTSLNRAVFNDLDKPVHYFLRDQKKQFFSDTLTGTVSQSQLFPDETKLQTLRSQLSDKEIT